EALRAVHHVPGTVPARARPHRRGVRARARLGQRVGAEPFSGRQPRQPTRLLLRVARELQSQRTELLYRQDQPARRTDLRDLLDRDERQQRAGAEPAVLLVEEQAKEVVLAEEL